MCSSQGYNVLLLRNALSLLTQLDVRAVLGRVLGCIRVEDASALGLASSVDAAHQKGLPSIPIVPRVFLEEPNDASVPLCVDRPLFLFEVAFAALQVKKSLIIPEVLRPVDLHDHLKPVWKAQVKVKTRLTRSRKLARDDSLRKTVAEPVRHFCLGLVATAASDAVALLQIVQLCRLDGFVAFQAFEFGATV